MPPSRQRARNPTVSIEVFIYPPEADLVQQQLEPTARLTTMMTRRGSVAGVRRQQKLE